MQPPAEGMLWPVLARQLALYAGGDTSLPAQTAEEVLRSVALALRLAGPAEGGESPGELLERGRGILKRRVEQGKILLRRAEESAPPYASRAMGDTLGELAGFFRKYDLRFFAHEVPCLVDYQLCLPAAETEGILYVNDYLTRLLLENEFCAKFDPARAQACLVRLRPGWRQEVSNLYEPLMAQALALTALEGDIYGLTLSLAQREEIERHLSENPAAWRVWMERAAARLGGALDLSHAGRSYLAQAAAELIRRALHAGSVWGAFAPEKWWRG